MQTDRVELMDMSEIDPKRVRAMGKLYDRWAERVAVAE
jgi:hypothetical protein